MYVLTGPLQIGRNIFHTWKERGKVVIYLGISPLHEKYVALIIEHVTGNISPKFNVSFDIGSHKVERDDFDSLWVIKYGFM